ncbi:hypothetical protein SAMN05216223_112200 [Actinacidiphila yanglinensis]|uniref:Uncharacterized protein n=1 Tax=Actinacidiphila yanglinensis TaxID=310779 RepID=A0A1H6D7G4_9ACTN|nr:hypothetical protein [Actinacidiphila yanglinensis]SEG81231.1 hypothetical protein SAMN05216223_112200 [Actinacidiphila yanglinensis]
MKRTVRLWLGIALAFLAVGGIVGAFLGGAATTARLGSGVFGALFAYLALRVWGRADRR